MDKVIKHKMQKYDNCVAVRTSAVVFAFYILRFATTIHLARSSLVRQGFNANALRSIVLLQKLALEHCHYTMSVFPDRHTYFSIPMTLCLLWIGMVILVSTVVETPQRRGGKMEQRAPIYGVMLANKIRTDGTSTVFLFDSALAQKDFCALPVAQKEE